MREMDHWWEAGVAPREPGSGLCNDLEAWMGRGGKQC